MTYHRVPVVLLILLAAFVAAVPPGAQEPAAVAVESRSYDVPDQGTLRLQIPAAWTQKVETTAVSGQVDIELIPENEQDHLMLVTALVGPDVYDLVDDPSALQETLMKAAQKAAARAEEGSLKMIRFKTESGIGCQFSATDKAPGPEEYRYLWQGSVVLGEGLLLGYTILSNDDSSPHLQDAFRLVKLATYEPAPRSAESGMRVEEGRLLDTDAGYAFSVPPGWRLLGGSAAVWAVIGHEETGARLKINVMHDLGDVEACFQVMKFALPFVGGRWAKVSDGWTKLGGRRAGDVAADFAVILKSFSLQKKK